MANNLERENAVGADMERIFGPAKQWHSIPAADLTFRTTAQMPPLRDRRVNKGRRVASLAAPILVMLLAGAVAVSSNERLVRPLGPAASHALVRHDIVAHNDLALPKQQNDVQMVVEQVTAPVAITRPVQVASPVPTATPTPLSTPVRVASVPPAHVHGKHGRRALASLETRRSTARSAVFPSRHQSERPFARTASSPCAPGSEEDRCIYQDVVHADRRLRAAYAKAVRDGRPHRELTSVVRQWKRARDMSINEPDETIRRYDRLAAQLDGSGEVASR